MKHQCIHRNAFYFYIGDVLNQFQPEKIVSAVASLAFRVFCFVWGFLLWFTFCFLFGFGFLDQSVSQYNRNKF